MQALTGETLLRAWERTRATSPQQAAIAVLALAEPRRSVDDWARAPIGERDALLLELRAASLGQRLDGFAQCQNCGTELEFAFDANEIAQGLRARLDDPAPTVAGRRLRQANTLDLIAATAAKDEAEARAILIARTLCPDPSEAEGDSDGAAARRWLDLQTPEIFEALERAFDSVNASGEIRVQFACASCGDETAVDVDAAHFLIDEISRAAQRLLQDIHDLASVYGWSEQSILAMSDTRRSAYLERLRA